MSSVSLNAQTLHLSKDNIDEIIASMTLDEKVELLVGSRGRAASDATATVGTSSRLVPGGAGDTNPIERLGIPSIAMADGPAGVRISPVREGIDSTFYCTHFPVELALSAAWNTDLVNSVGRAMGDEARRYGVDILLAPATNLHRNPLNGRNFEYYSEDPLLSGKICAAMINGVQANGIGTSLKHFALNNQETNRSSMDVIGTPRTFREIYLKPFEIAVKESQPWTVMTSYNKINGTMASERADLVTEILRNEWGFDGMVMSDWYGGQYPVAQMIAGNDLLMPGKSQQKEEIKAAVLNGALPREILDRNIRNILECIVLTPRFNGYIAENNPDLKAHASITRQAATEGMVLLKNKKNTLPLNSKDKKIAVFGSASYDFIAGGTGSGDVNHAYVVSLMEGLANAGFEVDAEISRAYEQFIPADKAKQPLPVGKLASFLPKPRAGEINVEQLDLERAVRDNDIAMITIGKTSGEFIDRRHSDNYCLTSDELQLIQNVCKVFQSKGKRVVVILNVCGVIQTSDWISEPDAVLVAWMPGQEGGNSIADILTGKETPSGRLPMSWTRTYGEVSSAKDFPMVDSLSKDDIERPILGHADARYSGTRKDYDVTTYNEGIYVGYRYYTTNNIPVAFPFGYGLSYTTFKYDNMNVGVNDKGDIEVSVKVANKGKYAGKEIIQVYVSAPGNDMDKPSRELKGFAKTAILAPGENETVTITIPFADLASFNETLSAWVVEDGEYEILIARDAADTEPLSSKISVVGKQFPTVNQCLLLKH